MRLKTNGTHNTHREFEQDVDHQPKKQNNSICPTPHQINESMLI